MPEKISTSTYLGVSGICFKGKVHKYRILQKVQEVEIIFHSLLCPGNISYYVQLTGHNGNSMESEALHATLVSGPSVLSSSLAILIAVI